MNRHQFYNKYKRNQEAKKFYNSIAWESARTLALIRDYYLCQECLKNKLIVVYDVVHHIKPLLKYPKLALVEDNLICLCHACHNKQESDQKINKKNIKVVELEINPEII